MKRYEDLIDAESEEKEFAIERIDAIFDVKVRKTSDLPLKHRIYKKEFDLFTKHRKAIEDHAFNFGYVVKLEEEQRPSSIARFVIIAKPEGKWEEP